MPKPLRLLTDAERVGIIAIVGDDLSGLRETLETLAGLVSSCTDDPEQAELAGLCILTCARRLRDLKVVR